MKLNNIFFCLGFAALVVHCRESSSPISMVDGTASTTQLPYGVLKGETWKADPEAQYVKLHSYLDEAVKVSKIELDTCSPMESEIAMFINFDEVEVPITP